jgi:hypothetical protein
LALAGLAQHPNNSEVTREINVDETLAPTGEFTNWHCDLRQYQKYQVKI